MIILNKESIEKIFTMKDAIKSSSDAMAFYSAGKSDVPLRIVNDVSKRDGKVLYMPGYVEDAQALGIKIVSTFPENEEKNLPTVPSTMILIDDETGIVNAILDGTYLTQIRTGAVAGLATDLLSRKNSKVFTLIGTGGQARGQLEAVLAVRDIKTVQIITRGKEKGQRFIDEVKKDHDIEIYLVEDKEEAIRKSDIITAVTTSTTPVFSGKHLKEGTHINGVGSYRPDMVEIDEETMLKADKIYTDTMEGVLNESGDFINPLKSGKLKEEDITGEIGDYILGNIKGRENEKEITLFKTTGTAVLDIISARSIYENAVKKEIGEKVDI